MTTYRDYLLERCEMLAITDEEAGEEHWAAYLTDDQLRDAILRLRPDANVAMAECFER